MKTKTTGKLSNKQRAFLAAYAACGHIGRAAKSAGVNRRSHATWLSQSAEYQGAFADAQQEAVEVLEVEAVRRAVQGVQRLKFHRGEMIKVPLLNDNGHAVIDQETGSPVMVPYVEHEYSDVLLIFLLKAARPEKYRDHASETTGAGPNQLVVVEEIVDYYGNAARLAGESQSSADPETTA